ncbi:MAG: AAA family ATPase [Flavobacteriia bacterium]|nr:AAA family ATPase [Flavobacteriia bacterium]
MDIIGRKREKKLIESSLYSDKSALIVVYGRRRVGKTFLIRETCKNYLRFEFVGMHKATAKDQLRLFSMTLRNYTKIKQKIPANWLEAFQQLKEYCDSWKGNKKKVLFIDEFPWLDNNKSNFLRAFENFWNSYADKRRDLVVIICGSAASYMIKNIVRNKGGLHNRLTEKIKVEPFNLSETEALLKVNRVLLTRYDIIQLYMVMGGIPHYLQKIQPGESAVQAVERLCFEKDGFLRTEFNEVFASLFDHADNHERIIRRLAELRKGLTRNELIQKSNLPSGGNLTHTLRELEESGFIEKYHPYRNAKNALYRLSDEYSAFYVKYIENTKPSRNALWPKLEQQPSFRIWAGFSFETICLKHVDQLKEALKISGVNASYGNWTEKYSPRGAQVDLLIDRDDNVINLCEIKYCQGEYAIDKTYAGELMHKINTFKTATKTRKSLFLTFITTYGLKDNEYRKQLVQNSLTLEALFIDL